MKLKYFATLLLLFSEFAIGQVPGTPKQLFRSAYPQSFTLNVTINDFSSAIAKGQVLDNGQRSVTTSGIVWGTYIPTISSYDGISSQTGAGQITTTMTGLTLLQTYYIVTYATELNGQTTYGNIITYEHGTVVTPTGRKWLAFNLGATNIPSSINDTAGMGYLYQWGRESDGHQIVRPTISSATNTLATSSSPNNGGVFIQGQNNPEISAQVSLWTGKLTYADWLVQKNDYLWQGVNGTNNPCPTGYRLPTVVEFQSEASYWTSQDVRGAFASILKLTNNGYRSNNGNNIISNSQTTTCCGYYWTSDTYPYINTQNNQPSYYQSRQMIINNTSVNFPTGSGAGLRANGYGVRCIKD